jgi:hypothetical protein
MGMGGDFGVVGHHDDRRPGLAESLEQLQEAGRGLRIETPCGLIGEQDRNESELFDAWLGIQVTCRPLPSLSKGPIEPLSTDLARRCLGTHGMT